MSNSKHIYISTNDNELFYDNSNLQSNNTFSLICKYKYSNNDKLIDLKILKNIDNVLLDGIKLKPSDAINYKNSSIFSAIYNLFDNVNELPNGMFSNCKTLMKVSNIDKFDRISDDMFLGCNMLTNIKLDNVTIIGKNAFRDCTSLLNIEIPNVVKLNDYVFSNTKINNIKLNHNIRELPPFLFENCSELKKFSFECSEESQLALYEGVFAGCKNLELVNISRYTGKISTNTDEVFGECNQNYIDCNLIEYIEHNADEENTSLNEYELVNNYETQIYGYDVLPNYIFSGCKNLSPSNISFMNNIKTVGVGSLMGCKKFNYLDNKFKAINKCGFMDCTGLESIDLSECTFIDDYAFKNCSSLNYVNISEVNDLNKESIFENCTNLCSVDLPEQSENICGNKMFKNCIKLHDIDIDKFSIIGNESFINCSSIGENNEIEIKASRIGDYAFANCINIDSVKLMPYNNVELGNGIFMNCKSIREIELPENVDNLTYNMFVGCSSLERLTFKNTNGLAYMPNFDALNGCNNISYISFNENDRYRLVNNQCVIDKYDNTIIYVVKDINIFEINNTLGDNINISDTAFDNCKISILTINENTYAPTITPNTFDNISNKNFHVIISKNDPNYRNYVEILGRNKIYNI